jgi:shikimate kinase
MPLASRETLALAGMMGSGKSSVAAILGRLLGRRVVSTDERLVARFGKPVAKVFADDGEPAFRQAEREVVAELRGPLVLDLGGGAFCDPQSAEHLLRVGRVVFLDVTAPEAARRLDRSAGAAARPLAGAWERLAGERLPLYRRAHLTVSTDGLAPEAVARRIIGLL